MNQSDVNAYLGQIQLYFGRDYKDDELTLIRNHPQKAYTEALKEVELITGNFLPPPKDVIAFVERANNQIRPKEQPRPQLPPADKLQAAMGMKLVGLILDGKATRQQILDNIRKANDTKPGTGWMDAGTQLEKYYKRCKLDLNKKPSNYVSYELTDEML
jgi:hypothetical protein